MCHATKKTAPLRPLRLTKAKERCDLTEARIMYPFGRTGSGLSGKSVKAKLARRRTTDSFQKQSLQNEEENKPKVYQGSYGVYNGLTWEQLKDFLENRFEGWTFDKVEVRLLFCIECCPPDLIVVC